MVEEPEIDFEAVRESLARSRARGVAFGAAWANALSWARAGKGEAREVLDWSKDAWRRAYEGIPALSRVQAVASLLTNGPTQPDAGGELERRCGHCGASLEGRRPNVRYCNAECGRRAWSRRDKRAKLTNITRQFPKPPDTTSEGFGQSAAT
jgi:hypothetical protein